MIKKLSLVFIVMLLAIMSPIPFACKPSAPPVPLPPAEVKQAEFHVLSLEVAPETVVTRKSAVVTVKVSNVGKAAGTYTLILKVNGAEKLKKAVLIAAGATESISLEFVENVTGTYTLEVGGRIAKIRVIGAGLLGQDLASLRDSNGKIVSIERLEIESPFKDRVEVNKMRYLSDGLEVVGFLLKPKGNQERFPVLIFNRGGSREFGKIEISTLRYLSFFASTGYVVVASQYRGNDGGQGREEYGGSDINDVLNLIPLAESLPFVIPGKIVMLGYSRGGMMTYLAITMTDKVKAAAVVGGITDLIQTYHEHVAGWRYKRELIELIGGTPEQKEAEYKKRSAYFWPEKINTPILILHGEADRNVRVSQAQKLAEKLKELGKTYELVIYPGGSHDLGESARDRDGRILKWFAKYLE